MQRYEFKVVPAPRRGDKVRGVKTTEDRFALTLTEVMNAHGRDGWDYVRADTLPCDERVGLTGTKTSFQNMLVFRRVLVTGEGDRLVDPVLAPRPSAIPVVPRLGAPAAPAGAAPALGPAASPGVAAE
jgi:hypothetical protein